MYYVILCGKSWKEKKQPKQLTIATGIKANDSTEAQHNSSFIISYNYTILWMFARHYTNPGAAFLTAIVTLLY